MRSVALIHRCTCKAIFTCYCAASNCFSKPPASCRMSVSPFQAPAGQKLPPAARALGWNTALAATENHRSRVPVVRSNSRRDGVTLRDASQIRGPLPDDPSPVLYTHLCCPYAQRSLLSFLEKVQPIIKCTAGRLIACLYGASVAQRQAAVA